MATTIDPSKKTLILYFSLSGTTERAAQSLHRLLPNADLVRLEPAKAYTSYDDAIARGERELKGNVRPAIKDVPSIGQYRNIFLGFPAWWAQPPMIFHTLFDQYDLSGTMIIPFMTSMSTPMSQAMPAVRTLVLGHKANLVDGFRWDGNDQQMRTWLRTMNAIR